MPKALIYCRVSTKEQVDNLSLSTQEKECRAYCNRNGFEVAEVFVEEGESAKTVKRTAFQKMLSFVPTQKGKFQYLVVYSVSRFSRNTLDHAVVRAALSAQGISLRSATEPIDDSTTGKLMGSLFSAIAQHENDVRAERTKAGMQAALRLGRWTYKPPIGYLRSANPRVGENLVPDPERGPLVAKAFELYSTGLYTKADVLKQVTNLGLRTFKGKPVSMQTFNLTLAKPIYMGVLKVPRWNEEHPANFRPLVSREVFLLVQSVLNGKRPSVVAYQRNHPDFPLRRFVTCGKCGTPLTGSASKGRKKHYGYYHCHKALCKAVRVSKTQFEDAFVSYLDNLTPQLDYLRLFSEVTLGVWKRKQTLSQDSRISLENALRRLKEKRGVLEEAFIYRQAIDKPTYDLQRAKLQEDIAVKEIALNEQKLEEFDLEGALNFAQYLLEHMGRLWQEFPLDQKQRLQKVLFPSGASFADGKFGTTETAIVFKLLRPRVALNSKLVTLTGASWNQLIAWLKDLQTLRHSVEGLAA